MYFQHSADSWRDFPALVPGVLTPAEPVSRPEREPSYPRAPSGRDPVRVSSACSASWVGFGWPARPR